MTLRKATAPRSPKEPRTPRGMMTALAAVAVALAAAAGCAQDGSEEERVSTLGGDQGALVTGSQYARFQAFQQSGNDVYGVKGFLPPNNELSSIYHQMTDNQRLGLATWHLFASERGDFFRVSQKTTWNGQNMLRVVDSRGHDDRFERSGLLNDPDCAKRSTPDEFGFYLDDCQRDPYSTGVIGLRLRPNPAFDPAKWKALGNGDVNKAAEKWLHAPSNRFEWKSAEMERTVAVEPPYEVSMTCTVCHASPNPTNPPANPNFAKWSEIVFALGNQYFNEGPIFADGVPKDDFLHEVLNAQPPGTSDTSRMATDHIYNPNTINAIANLKYRPLHKERVKQKDLEGYPVWNGDIKPATCDGDTCEVDTFRVLKDGADSSGISGAALRVFINIGACFDELRANIDPIFGKARGETPISRRKLETECKDYQQLVRNAPALVDYLFSLKPFRLAEAPGGAARVKAWDDPQMILGRQVFARECATCHSSKQPEYPTGHPSRADALFERDFATWDLDAQRAWLKDPARVAWFTQQVQAPTFFEENYLSDERRYPLQLIGSNSARALGTNAGPSGVWAEYASVDYQTLPPADIPLYQLRAGQVSFDKTVKGPMGVGHLRTPSLWGVWTSAPLLHNNALGTFNGGIDTPSRLAAYDDAMEQLLGLKVRPTVISKTKRFTALTTIPVQFNLPFTIPGFDPNKLRLGLPVPQGLPVAVVGNLELGLSDLGQLRPLDALRFLDPDYFMERTQKFITVFDPIENKGHEFGYDLTAAEKRALIELLRSL